MQILIIQTGLEKVEWNLNHSKGIPMQIYTIRKGFELLDCKFQPFKRVRSIWMQILTIRKGFEAFECKF